MLKLPDDARCLKEMQEVNYKVEWILKEEIWGNSSGKISCRTQRAAFQKETSAFVSRMPFDINVNVSLNILLVEKVASLSGSMETQILPVCQPLFGV